MCPISGFFQSLIVIVTLLLVCHAVLVKSMMNISFKPSDVTVYMYDTITVEYNATSEVGDTTECLLYSEDTHIAYMEKEYWIRNLESGSFNITGNFLGQTVISCKDPTTNIKVTNDNVAVKCLRKQRLVDRIFTASTATLVAIIYINFGCVVQWTEVRQLIKTPIGPGIGIFGQFVTMPLITYGLGLLLFPDNPEMRLGMFFTGVSPAGGASNIWTAILEGNIELSILMTTISTIAAFGFMPMWLFTLGKTIFRDADLEMPYAHITSFVFALLVPLGIGYLINRYLKKTGAFMGRILKGFSSLLILFIIIFAIVTNLYLFELFSWRIVVAGMGVPWLGYFLGYILAKIFKQPQENALAIAIETGIQNTGIAIYLLRFTLEPLHADLTTVIPVAVAIMTPFPLTAIYIYQKIRQRWWPYKKSDEVDLCKRESTSSKNYRHSHARQDSAVACLS
ncbi:ileal sodium/bile acid cotransporter-like isoform X2 [Sitophilus oryzae]|nr:ileal sodium/bile acid cotransporter-like isoform X2 [Sitophilus oryzae]XP_030754010.1 ileal sodium/bile acid cotransporter-like isoform X2 [Sitophilus oryzae]XP_030754011.1 ileal sodium/bile acid cotransporter-like isoform X2 [Sitophilus oryzae]